MRRGIKRTSSFRDTIVLKGIRSDGSLAFRFEADADVYRDHWVRRLQTMLDEIDPPLQLVVGDRSSD